MALLTLSLREDLTNYTTRYDLNGKEYIFVIIYNSREDRWYLTIQDDAGVTLVQGVKLANATPLLSNYRPLQPGLPPGVLMLYHTTGDAIEMNRTNVAEFTLGYNEQ